MPNNEQPHKQIRSLPEAISEVKRELQVRERCYPRWVEDGRLTDIDASDRFDRMEAALRYLQEIHDATADNDAGMGTLDPSDEPSTDARAKLARTQAPK